MFRQDYTCPPYSSPITSFRIRAVTRYGHTFQSFCYLNDGTGLVRVRSPLLTESRLMSFPPATEMFQFTGFASRNLCIQLRDT